MALKDIKFNVNADLLARAHLCVSTEEMRYLNGVHIEPCQDGGVLMVATDGHILVAIHDASGSIEGGTAIVSPNRAVLAACRPRKTKTPSIRRVLVADGRLSIVAEGEKGVTPLGFDVCVNPTDDVIAFQWRDVLIDGTFPDWRNIVCKAPPKFSEPATGFNSAYLERLGRVLSLKEEEILIVCSRTGGEADPAWVSCPMSSIDGFGIIMPVRLNTPKIPGWITFPSADASKKKAA